MGCCKSSDVHRYSVQISSERPGETGVLRNPEYTASLAQCSFLGHRTMCEVYTHTFTQNKTRNCLASKVNGSYEFKTYEEVERIVDGFGAGLKSMVRPGTDGYTIAGIYGKNRAEWVMADIAMTLYGMISVPLYDTLGKNAILHILKETELMAVVTGNQGAMTLVSLLQQEPLRLKTLVLWEDPSPDLLSAANSLHLDVKTFNEVVNLGKALPMKRAQPQPNDLWTICYTSGTTGVPKGVMISHLAQVLGVTNIQNIVHFNKDDVHLSWLPLAHSFERNGCSLMLYVGGVIYFSSGSPPLLFSELAEVKPTYVGAVPRLWKKIHDILKAQIGGFTGEQAELARQGIEAKLARLHSTGLTTDPTWDSRLFNTTKQIIGGRCRIAVSGGAPISQQVLDFLKIVLCTPFTEGYGQTECPGGICMTHLVETQGGHVGGPGCALEIKLKDVPELDFRSTPVALSLPSGEVCVRGPLTFMGYYKNPPLTSEAVDSEGWLHTGDIGSLLENGALKIIDRKKQVFKLSQGEYVAPEKVERVLANCPLVGHVWVYGDSLQDYCIALVVPDELVLPKWAAAQGLQGDFSQLCKAPQVLGAIQSQFLALGKAADLMSFEMPKRIRVLDKPFSIELDQLTPTLKIKRNVLKTQFKDIIEEEYAKGRTN